MHNKKVTERYDPCDMLEASAGESDGKENIIEVKQSNISQKLNLLKNWRLMSTIFVYCVFSLQEIAYSEVSQFPFSLT